MTGFAARRSTKVARIVPSVKNGEAVWMVDGISLSSSTNSILLARRNTTDAIGKTQYRLGRQHRRNGSDSYWIHWGYCRADERAGAQRQERRKRNQSDQGRRGKAGKSGEKWGKVGERFLEHGKIFENYLYRNEKLISRQTRNFRKIKDGRGFTTAARSSWEIILISICRQLFWPINSAIIFTILFGGDHRRLTVGAVGFFNILRIRRAAFAGRTGASIWTIRHIDQFLNSLSTQLTRPTTGDNYSIRKLFRSQESEFQVGLVGILMFFYRHETVKNR